MDDLKHIEKQLNVSRETFQRLEALADLLKKWNPKINLVSKATINTLWTRHILDSAQIFENASKNGGHWVDIGSGGGFPGLVVAILNADLEQPYRVTLIESDIRKCSFLRTVLRETNVSGTVLSKRIEAADPQHADVLSARALADLSQLCAFSERHLSDEGLCLFPKGASWKKEVLAAEESWSFRCEAITSVTEERAVILKIREVKRV